MTTEAIRSALAAFTGALFLKGRSPIVHQFGDRWVFDAVLGTEAHATLPVTITIDASGIAVVSKELIRVKGRSLDATEAALRARAPFDRRIGYQLDREALEVRLTAILSARFLGGMTLEGAERVLDDVLGVYISERERTEALIHAIDASRGQPPGAD